MKTLITVIAVLIVVGVIAAWPQQTATHPLVTRAEYERWQTELSNWGRWGKDDELGTLNLITPAKRKQAAALVKMGSRYPSPPMRALRKKPTILARLNGPCSLRRNRPLWIKSPF